MQFQKILAGAAVSALNSLMLIDTNLDDKRILSTLVSSILRPNCDVIGTLQAVILPGTLPDTGCGFASYLEQVFKQLPCLSVPGNNSSLLSTQDAHGACLMAYSLLECTGSGVMDASKLGKYPNDQISYQILYSICSSRETLSDQTYQSIGNLMAFMLGNSKLSRFSENDSGLLNQMYLSLFSTATAGIGGFLMRYFGCLDNQPGNLPDSPLDSTTLSNVRGLLQGTSMFMNNLTIALQSLNLPPTNPQNNYTQGFQDLLLTLNLAVNNLDLNTCPFMITPDYLAQIANLGAECQGSPGQSTVLNSTNLQAAIDIFRMATFLNAFHSQNPTPEGNSLLTAEYLMQQYQNAVDADLTNLKEDPTKLDTYCANGDYAGAKQEIYTIIGNQGWAVFTKGNG